MGVRNSNNDWYMVNELMNGQELDGLCQGKSHQYMMTGGAPILGNHHIMICHKSIAMARSWYRWCWYKNYRSFGNVAKNHIDSDSKVWDRLEYIWFNFAEQTYRLRFRRMLRSVDRNLQIVFFLFFAYSKWSIDCMHSIGSWELYPSIHNN